VTQFLAGRRHARSRIGHPGCRTRLLRRGRRAFARADSAR
jgi:hypothetical protein